MAESVHQLILSTVFLDTETLIGSGGSMVKNPPVMQETRETRVQSLGREDPLEEEMAIHSSVLA